MELGDPGTDSTTAGLPDPPSTAVPTEEVRAGGVPAPTPSPRRPFVNVWRVAGAAAVAGLVLLTIVLARDYLKKGKMPDRGAAE